MDSPELLKILIYIYIYTHARAINHEPDLFIFIKITNQFDLDFLTSWPHMICYESGFCDEAIHGLVMILICATSNTSRGFCRTIYFLQWWSQACLVHAINTASEIVRIPVEEAFMLTWPTCKALPEFFKKKIHDLLERKTIRLWSTQCSSIINTQKIPLGFL